MWSNADKAFGEQLDAGYQLLSVIVERDYGHANQTAFQLACPDELRRNDVRVHTQRCARVSRGAR